MKKAICLILSVITLIGIVPMGIYAEERPFPDVPADDIEAAAQREDGELGEDIAEAPSTVTEKGMQFRIENLEDVKSIRYAYGEYDTEKDIKYGESAVSHSAKNLRKRGDNCILQFTKPGLVSIVVTYNDGTRDFYKYDVIKSEPTVTRDGGNSITLGNLDDLKVLRYVKGEYDSSYDIKRASGSVAISGKNIDSDTYTLNLDRETYTFCVQYNDESYNYYVTGVCGDNLTWVYDMQSATLTISGEGEMYSYGYEDVPWLEYGWEIKSAVLNEGVTTLSNFAFVWCKSLESIDLPSTLEMIGGEVFYECFNLKSVVIPDKVPYIETGTFMCCTSLESVVIGNGVEKINMQAFYGCSNLKTVVFGNSVKYIEDYAFSGCTSLYDIELPDSLIEIGMCALSGIGYAKNKNNWENNLLYLDGHLIAAVSKIGTCIIKNGTKSIANYVFEDSYLDVVYIPETLKHIPYSGFYNSGSNKLYYYVVKGSYGEEFVKKYNCTYSYFNPAEIYG